MLVLLVLVLLAATLLCCVCVSLHKAVSGAASAAAMFRQCYQILF